MANNKKVTWSYDDVYGLAQQEGLWDAMSDADRQLAQSDPDTAMSVLNHKIGYRDATTDADRAYHHAAAQNDRKSAGYTGDSSGSGYYQVRRFSYDDAPTYASKYQGRIDALANQILNRAAFSYDPKTDPQYAAYKKEYAREGRRASEDALGQAAALTGGMPSTAAIVASQQAGDYYAAQMADKIPELYRLAYDMYVKEGDTQRANMSMLQALEEGDYNKYLNALKQYNTDRSFAYGVYSDDYNRDYQEERDKISDARYDDETSYERQMAFAKLAAQYGDFARLRGLGINPYADLAMSGGGSSGGGSGRSGGGGSGGSGSGSTAERYGLDDLFMDAYRSGNPEVYLENNAKAYGYKSSSDLKKAYKEWYNQGLGGMGIDPQQAVDWYNKEVNDWARSTASGLNFQNRQQAASYLKQQGVEAQYANRVMSEDDWRRKKQDSPGSAEAAYSSYKDYLKDYVRYIESEYGR